MSKRPFVSTLPSPVREELNRRLVASNFGQVVQHAEWLTSKGYAIGKSAVGEYSKLHRSAIEAEVSAKHTARGKKGEVAARLACLTAAASSGGSTSAVLKRAEMYATWVGVPGSPGSSK